MVAQKPFLIHSQVPAKTSALPRVTLVTSAVAALRHRILSGQFAEGEALNQVAIAREFAISRIPLREAMRQLEAEGLLIFQAGKGAVVSGLSLGEVREVVALRARLEPELLGEAIPKLREQDFEEASAILDQFDRALEEHDVAVWGELNWRFHSTLCAPSGRALTMGIVQSLHNLNQRYARVQISVAKWEHRAAREHRAILSACRRRERHRAANLLKVHILTAGRSLVELLEESRAAAILPEAK
jgi:DNA-binding GntR family transcriptional regulator